MNKCQDKSLQIETKKHSALDSYYDVTGDGVIRADTSKLSRDQGFRRYVAEIFSTANLVEKKPILKV